ncbi:MAG: sugar ABC transporter permease [Finegoldia magna]|uniref:sugar ABC transporter permease n=1 Tax=Finegoldia magna TaxID=1260 RepID=UPI0029069C34|nr:sugar ABC transporter permease [Finegoldia magna]MDU5368964.1 sugar ABC transporter permease [Finegoldia magna]MDU5444480.1 sugar ABC transporter permease [Finegoldia magna]
MKEIFKLDMKLRFKEIKIDKISGAIQFILIISAIFLFLKYLSSLPSDHYVIKALFAFFLAFMGFFKIRTDSITQREMDFMTFFPRFNKTQVRKYFMYKKAMITYIFIIYLLFPTSVDILEIKSFFMYGSIIYFYMFVDTLFFYVTENSKKSNILYTALRISYYIIFASYLYIPNVGINLEKILPELKLRYMIPLFTILFCVNPLLLKSPNQKGQ